MYLDCGLDCRLVWSNLRLIENKHCLSRRYISRALCKQLYANFGWAHRDKALRDDPNNSFGDFRSRARWRNRSCFTDVHFWTWIDANMGRKMNVSIFCSFITQTSFLVILEICLTASVIHSKLKLITNIDFVLTLAPKAER